ncbi:Scr1 family TA system antitoxin-like transcriptional regulator [Actinomycetospora aeridis]|uniref:Scr1 family TA system antitoxin-like transcriptional regulator n=1 Tax=Actinomycetospora aeridis TaxID=3129231 RepID=A0ABU8N1C3_9PSEU
MSPRQVRYPDLGAALAHARAASKLSGPQLAERLGWPSQSKVSLLESGKQRPSVEDVRAWAEATSADVDELLDARERALTRHLDIREAARTPGGVEALQGSLADLEAGSTTLAEYQPTLIPGPVQTADYTRAWLGQPGRVELGGAVDVETIVESRRERQRALRERGTKVTIAVEPAALTAVYDARDVQLAQLHTLSTAALGGMVELIVSRRPLAMIGGFELLDDAVMVENVTGARIMADPEVVAQFAAALDRLRRTGTTGRAAVRAVEEAARSL